MDGFKERLSNSLRLRLAGWLSVAIVVVALAAGVFSFAAAFNEANELQDDILRQVAAIAGAGGAHGAGEARVADTESQIIVEVLSRPRGAGEPVFPSTLANGLQTVHLHQTSYRVLVRTQHGGERLAVAQATGVRDEIARDSALRTLFPLLVLVPVLLLVVVGLTGRMLGPVTRLSNDIDRRGEGELHGLDPQGLPTEIRPFVTAINRLLERVERSMAAQRRFVADAAHELRSPLTALSLQAERLGSAEMSIEAGARLLSLRQGIDRGRHLLEQLLDLARAQADRATPGDALQVLAIYRRVLEDLLPQAEAKAIDIGIAEGNDVRIVADAQDLFVVVSNLVDNAIRYTPCGGRVDLSAARTAHDLLLEVEDNGTGIPALERARVLDPFYRVAGSDQAGSGLGLSIVKAVVERLGGRIELQDSTRFGSGLKVSVVLPANGQQGPSAPGRRLR